jgi:gamma-glutamyltranspeptidase/glutathione hydrolase
MAGQLQSTSTEPAVAPNGMVATSEPLAVETGLRVLQQGGNAIDAAIAAGAMIGLTEPMSCGIGGDLFVLVWDSRAKRLYGLNASGPAPHRANVSTYQALGYRSVPLEGPLSWTVPGCVAGWAELAQRFGTKPMSALLEPAIRAAEEGFVVQPKIAQAWREAEARLRRWPSSAATYLAGGRAPQAGERFRNPDLARTYRLLAQQGPEAFYRGSIARSIVAFSERVGGLFSLQDFERYRAAWEEPISTEYRGYTVWQMPPNTQGLAVLQMLNILQAFDLKKLGHNSADYLHLLIETKKIVFEDRARYYADPAFTKVPIQFLLSPAYAEHRRLLVRWDEALRNIAAGSWEGEGDTIYMAVVDRHRNCVSYIQSNYHSFGSGIVPEGLGFCLQNRGALFALDPTHPNRIEPYKRPFHTIIPGFVTKDGKPWLCFGVMGGDMQPQGQVQVLLNLIEFGMDPQRAGAAPRFCHFGSSSPRADHVMTDGGQVGLEHGIPETVREALRKRGHRLLPPGGAFGGYQGILLEHTQGVLIGGSDPRKDGYAKGY